MPTVPHPQLEMDNSNSNSFCSCLKYGWATPTKKMWMRSETDRLLCDCGEMSAGDDCDEVFDWTFEGGEMTETAEVRDGSRGRGIDFVHADWRS